MTARFKPHHPEHYPVAWHTAAKQALAEPGSWVSVDWARGRAGAVSRMKRLRAFRDGVAASPQAIPGAAEALANGLTLTFRTVQAVGVWDVQLCWKAADKEQVITPIKEILKKAMGGDGHFVEYASVGEIANAVVDSIVKGEGK